MRESRKFSKGGGPRDTEVCLGEGGGGVREIHVITEISLC